MILIDKIATTSSINRLYSEKLSFVKNCVTIRMIEIGKKLIMGTRMSFVHTEFRPINDVTRTRKVIIHA